MSIFDYLKNIGMAEDRLLDAETGGPYTETFSLRWARAQADGSTMGCIICSVLAVLIQKNHCAKQLANVPMTIWNYIRAFVCINAVFAAPLILAWWLLK
jgi:hypothetical protein